MELFTFLSVILILTKILLCCLCSGWSDNLTWRLQAGRRALWFSSIMLYTIPATRSGITCSRCRSLSYTRALTLTRRRPLKLCSVSSSWENWTRKAFLLAKKTSRAWQTLLLKNWRLSRSTLESGCGITAHYGSSNLSALRKSENSWRYSLFLFDFILIYGLIIFVLMAVRPLT